jgi:hypothetical protein
MQIPGVISTSFAKSEMTEVLCTVQIPKTLDEIIVKYEVNLK